VLTRDQSDVGADGGACEPQWATTISTQDIATRLFVSPRTVQSHLRHVYNKLGVMSGVQLAQGIVNRPGFDGASFCEEDAGLWPSVLAC
jgi:Bacterial regulatory proteins, luxR family